jgi:CBS domain-containing protein
MSEANPTTRKNVVVREIMNSPIITGFEEETIEDIAQRMSDCKISSIIIMSGQKPTGIITEHDIITKVVTKNKKPSEIQVKEIMSSPLLTISDEKTVTEATKFMRRMNIKKLGVVNKEKLMGVLSITDIVSVMPEIYAIITEKSRIIASEFNEKTVHLANICDNCDQWFDDLHIVDGKHICHDCRVETASELIHE